jgi:hypothetical protein
MEGKAMSTKLEKMVQLVREKWVPEFQLQVSEDIPWATLSKPLERLKELVEQKKIGSLSDYQYSFMGYIPLPFPLQTRTAPDVAHKLVRESVDFALLVPT